MIAHPKLAFPPLNEHGIPLEETGKEDFDMEAWMNLPSSEWFGGIDIFSGIKPRKNPPTSTRNGALKSKIEAEIEPESWAAWKRVDVLDSAIEADDEREAWAQLPPLTIFDTLDSAIEADDEVGAWAEPEIPVDVEDGMDPEVVAGSSFDNDSAGPDALARRTAWRVSPCSTGHHHNC